MLRCMYSVSARIFCSGSEIPVVSSATFCLISGEAMRLVWVSESYQRPTSFQEPAVFARSAGSRGKYFTPAHPATTCHEGIDGSISTAGRSASFQTYLLVPWLCGFSSAWLNQLVENSHPGGICRMRRAVFTGTSC